MKNSHVVWIDDTCIGCTKCIDACPVDCIIGASKQLHGVLTEFCIGCDLCIPVCPVSCIHKETTPSLDEAQKRQRAQTVKKRYQAKQQRLQQQELEKEKADLSATQNMAELLQAALVRSQQKRREFVWQDDNES